MSKESTPTKTSPEKREYDLATLMHMGIYIPTEAQEKPENTESTKDE